MKFSQLSNLKCPIQRESLMMKSSGNLENPSFTGLSWNTLSCQLHTRLQNISFCHWMAFRDFFTKYIYTLGEHVCHRPRFLSDLTPSLLTLNNISSEVQMQPSRKVYWNSSATSGLQGQLLLLCIWCSMWSRCLTEHHCGRFIEIYWVWAWIWSQTHAF